MNYKKETKRLNMTIAIFINELEKRANDTKLTHNERVAHKKDLDLIQALLVGGK